MECRCECREDLVNNSDKVYIWNPSNCACECDKSCGIGQYLDYKSCVCRNSLVDKLVKECTSATDENKIYNKTLKVTSSNDCASCTLCVVLFAVFLSISVITSGASVLVVQKKKQLDLKKMFLMLIIQNLKH